MAPEDLEIGPSLLAPGPPRHPDLLARLLIWPLLAVLVFTTVVFYIMYSPLSIVGDSMEPTLIEGERVLRTKGYAEARREDIVIIDSETAANTDDIVKRVIAVGGDTVEIRDDIAIVNGAQEPLGRIMLLRGHGLIMKPVRVPEGYVYVMGDNRPVSLDSRMIGAVPLEKIRGRVVFVFAPVYAIRSL